MPHRSRRTGAEQQAATINSRSPCALGLTSTGADDARRSWLRRLPIAKAQTDGTDPAGGVVAVSGSGGKADGYRSQKGCAYIPVADAQRLGRTR